MNNQKTLLSYRENDLFNAFIPKLGIKATEIIIFPRGTESEVIKRHMQSMTDYDIVIIDYTVKQNMPENNAQHVMLGTILSDAFELDLTKERYIESFKKAIKILNSDRKPIALVKDSLCDHLPSAEWFNASFACYKKSQEDPTKLEHFVPEEGYEAWKNSKEYAEIREGYNSGLLKFKSGWKQKPFRSNDFSPYLCKSASIDLIIDFFQDSCSLNARIVETVKDVHDSEFMIVDSHVRDIPRTNDIMILPLEDAVNRTGGNESMVDPLEVEKYLKEKLKAHIG